MATFDELEEAFEKVKTDSGFWREYTDIMSTYSCRPTPITFAGNLTANRGTAQESGGVITWEGGVSAADTVVIQYDATVDNQVIGPALIVNTAYIDGGIEEVLTREASVMVDGYLTFIPFTVRNVP